MAQRAEGRGVATASSKAHDLCGMIEALVRVDGTASSEWAAHLSRPEAALRDIADAVHALAVVHGAFPGVVDHAGAVARDAAMTEWLDAAAHAMAAERGLLARLTSLVGPRPSTPGQRDCETAVIAQRHALEMLARSDRNGCAVGAAIAFVLDWKEVRLLLLRCSDRIGFEAPDVFAAAQTAPALLRRLHLEPGAERAVVFGAQQMLAQHRGLWSLLEARAAARTAL